MKLGSLIRDKASGLRKDKKSNKSQPQQDGVDDHNNGYTSHSISSLNSDHLHDNNSKKDDASDLRREGISGIDTSDRGSRQGSRHGGSPSE